MPNRTPTEIAESRVVWNGLLARDIGDIVQDHFIIDLMEYFARDWDTCPVPREDCTSERMVREVNAFYDYIMLAQRNIKVLDNVVKGRYYIHIARERYLVIKEQFHGRA